MAESLTIARPYAEAAFKIARELDALPAWSDALSRLASVAATQTARDFIGNPKVDVAQVAAVIADTAGTLSDEQRNFVAVLARDARIASAFPLSEAQLADIVETLRAKYGRQVKASVSVDPDLIGGVSIRVGDEVMDASVRGKLAQLAGVLRA
jgi:F-type H+-transporting ATPase subunit delta